MQGWTVTNNLFYSIISFQERVFSNCLRATLTTTLRGRREGKEMKENKQTDHSGTANIRVSETA
jgi:hypothetical protein